MFLKNKNKMFLKNTNKHMFLKNKEKTNICF